jgi:hypothetical protein
MQAYIHITPLNLSNTYIIHCTPLNLLRDDWKEGWVIYKCYQCIHHIFTGEWNLFEQVEGKENHIQVTMV